jgi:thioredoxin 1
MTKVINEDNFQETVSTGVSLVDFYATWCGPCKSLAATIDELSNDFEGKAVIGKIDVDTNAEAASLFDIRGIPTVLVFKDGQVIDRLVGVHPKSKYSELLNNAL